MHTNFRINIGNIPAKKNSTYTHTLTHTLSNQKATIIPLFLVDESIFHLKNARHVPHKYE